MIAQPPPYSFDLFCWCQMLVLPFNRTFVQCSVVLPQFPCFQPFLISRTIFLVDLDLLSHCFGPKDIRKNLKKIVFHESYYDEFSFKLTWLQQNLSSTPGLTTQNHQQLISSKPIKIKALYIYTIYAFSYFNNRSIEVIVFSMCVLLDSLFIYIKAWP